MVENNVFDQAECLLEEAIDTYKPRYVMALFSGGHDSLVATHLASRHDIFSFALHINTGIGIPETRQFVVTTCKSLGIPLKEYAASEYRNAKGEPAPQLYSEFVCSWGFPGPAMHTRMYNRLKERPLRQAIRDLERSRQDRVLLVTGLRAQESARRGRHVKPVQVWEGTKVWVAPLWNFTKLQVNDYLTNNNLPRNLVVDLLHKSGDCLCGAFAHPGEKEEIRLWFPEIACGLDELEKTARARGFSWGWGEKPNRRQKPEAKNDAGLHDLCSACRWINE